MNSFTFKLIDKPPSHEFEDITHKLYHKSVKWSMKLIAG